MVYSYNGVLYCNKNELLYSWISQTKQIIHTKYMLNRAILYKIQKQRKLLRCISKQDNVYLQERGRVLGTDNYSTSWPGRCYNGNVHAVVVQLWITHLWSVSCILMSCAHFCYISNIISDVDNIFLYNVKKETLHLSENLSKSPLLQSNHE